MLKSNVEKVTDAMEFGSPLNQIVVMSAIEKYCEQIAGIDEQPESWNNVLVSWKAWQASAKDVADRLHAE
tara:strand:- start:357 stop:566 length:210 start_codon:yes stop_codon:yes gene_type:complete